MVTLWPSREYSELWPEYCTQGSSPDALELTTESPRPELYLEVLGTTADLLWVLDLGQTYHHNHFQHRLLGLGE